MNIEEKDDLLKPAVVVNHLYKSFKLPHEQASGIKQLLINKLKGKKGYEVQNVLKDISFKVREGEFFGIVGRNGSGKSTLLKLLAEIYVPDKGDVKISGSLTPFIELGVGFNMELTGRENVFLNGALLGFSRNEIAEMYDDIVGFAEIENFMDQKLKNYSSGMQVRLAFSIAIRAKSDILLIDEVLAVGDSSFQEKCYKTFYELKKKGVTIILVTHDMSAVLKFCDRALLINEGSIAAQGDPKVIADKYLQLNFENKSKEDNRGGKSKHDTTKPAVQKVSFLSNRKSSSFNVGDEVGIEILLENGFNIPTHVGVQVFNSDNVYCFGINSFADGMQSVKDSTCKIKFIFNKMNLLPGNYSITVATMDDSASTTYNYYPEALSFRISNSTDVQGIANIEHEWSVEKISNV